MVWKDTGSLHFLQNLLRAKKICTYVAGGGAGGGAGDMRHQMSYMKTTQCTHVWTCEVVVLSDRDGESRGTNLLTSELFTVFDILTHTAP